MHTNDVIIYVICHNDDTVEKAKRIYSDYSWARILKMDDTVYMESFTHIHHLGELYDSWKDAKFVGTITHSANTKILIPHIDKMIQNIDEYDVVPFITCTYDLVYQTNKCHPDVLDILRLMLSQTEYSNYDTTSKFEFHISNYWITKPKHMIAYIKFITTLYNIMETDENIKSLLFKDPKGYFGANQTKNEILKDNKIGFLPKEKMIEKFGTTHYSGHCFLCERLPSIFFHNNNFKCYNYTSSILKFVQDDDYFFVKDKINKQYDTITQYVDYAAESIDDGSVYVIDKLNMDGFPDIVCNGDSTKLDFWNHF